MRRIALMLSIAALVVLAGVPALAVEPFVLYDDFSGRTINPAKWFGAEGNHFGPLAGVTPGYGTDAQRQVRAGSLRMSYRSHGNTASDTTSTFSTLRLHFIAPAAVTAIKATVTVRAFELVPCPTNATITTRTRVRLHGIFFNAATPTPGEFTNDVIATVRLHRRVDSAAGAGVFDVQGFAFRCDDPACNVSTDLPILLLGTVAAGTAATVSLQWDPDNNQFIYSFGATTLTQPYTWSDASPPGVQLKRLDLQNVVPDCTAAPRPRAFLDASIDNVYVNAAAAAAVVLGGARPSGASGGDGK